MIRCLIAFCGSMLFHIFLFGQNDKKLSESILLNPLGEIKISLINEDKLFYPLPYEVDLEYLRTEDETYYDLENEELIIDELETGHYNITVYYTDNWEQEIKVTLDCESNGILSDTVKIELCPNEIAESYSSLVFTSYRSSEEMQQVYRARLKKQQRFKFIKKHPYHSIAETKALCLDTSVSLDSFYYNDSPHLKWGLRYQLEHFLKQINDENRDEIIDLFVSLFRAREDELAFLNIAHLDGLELILENRTFPIFIKLSSINFDTDGDNHFAPNEDEFFRSIKKHILRIDGVSVDQYLKNNGALIYTSTTDFSDGNLLIHNDSDIIWSDKLYENALDKRSLILTDAHRKGLIEIAFNKD